METLKLSAHIDETGMLKLEVPTGLSAGAVEVVVVVQTRQAESIDAKGWPLGFFERTYGALADDPIERSPQPPLEDRDTLE